MTGDAKVATHPQSIVGPQAIPKFQTLGRYTVIGELGRGGMGLVYLAEDTVLKRKVALKIPQFEPHKAEQMQARFIREAQMAAQLSHINICQIYDVGVIDGQYVMAMEYIEGKTLSEFTKAGKMISARQAVYFVRKVANAVEAAHQKGLIHRDLKPGNIMLPKADSVTKVIEPKVMDFGLAKSLEARTTELTKSGMIVGTPCYMSKEQWSGKDAQLGPQCDIYSLGIILYELLTGKLPYDVDDEEPATAWFVKLVTQPQIRPTERNADVDPALEAIVMRAIAKEAADRYPSMAAFASDLDAWLKKKTTSGKQSVVGQLPPELLPLASPEVKPAVSLDEIESIKSQPSLAVPHRRKPPGALPPWAMWAAGGAAALLLGITLWFNFEKKPDGTIKTNGGGIVTDPPQAAEDSSRSNPSAKSSGQGSTAVPAGEEAWTYLFDGTDVSQWSTLGPFSVDKGQLVSNGTRGNAITRNEYSDFELEAEWRIGKGGNSGIYYREPSTHEFDVGNEFSIADDDSYDPSVMTPDRRTGSLYGVIAPSISAAKPVGEWNQTRIICRGTTVEHWLNGGRIVRYDTASDEFRQAITQSTIHVGKENVGSRQTGHILLQGHTGEVAYRSVRVRELSAESTSKVVDESHKLSGELLVRSKAGTFSENEVYRGTWTNDGTDESPVTITVTKRDDESYESEWVLHKWDARWKVRGHVDETLSSIATIDGIFVDKVNGDHPNEKKNHLVATYDKTENSLSGIVHYDRGGQSEFEATLTQKSQVEAPPPVAVDSEWSGTLTVNRLGMEPSVREVTATISDQSASAFTVRFLSTTLPGWEWHYECEKSTGQYTIKKATLVSAPDGYEELPGEKLISSSKISISADRMDIILSRPVTEGNRQAHYELTRTD